MSVPEEAHAPPRRALFCGGRDWKLGVMIMADMSALPKDCVIITGGAPGADTLAAESAWKLGYHCAVVPALWHIHGRGAGPLRNQAMLALHPDIVYAYNNGGRGTADMMKRARAAAIDVIERRPRAAEHDIG